MTQVGSLGFTFSQIPIANLELNCRTIDKLDIIDMTRTCSSAKAKINTIEYITIDQ